MKWWRVLPSVEMLDGRSLSNDEREKARVRFERGEIDHQPLSPLHAVINKSTISKYGQSTKLILDGTMNDSYPTNSG